MGTRKDETRELLKRVRAVGWTVRTTRNGNRYVVKTHTGQTFTFGSVSRHSGDGSHQRELHLAERYGLVELERQAAAQRESRLANWRQADADTLAQLTSGEDTGETKTDSDDESEGEETMKKIVAQVDGALGHVDGVAIMESAPAKITTPVTNGPAVLGSAEELLLADGRVVYRCLRPAATPRNPDARGVCHKTFGSAMSLRSHMTFHSRKDDTSRFLRRTTKKRAKMKSSSVTATPANRATPSKTRSAKTSGATRDSDASIARKLTAIGEQLIIVSGNLSRIGEDIIQLASDVRDTPTTDPEVLAKAQKFDQMQSLLHPNG